MKKVKTLKTVMIAGLSLSLAGGMTSCKKEGCMDEKATNYDEKAKKDDGTCSYPEVQEDTNLSGDVTENRTLKTGNTYTLKGGVHVKEGATLTIEKGVTVEGDATESVPYILVEPGAKIMAEGTADEPIILTATVKERGSWGGLIVCGKAPVNSGERTAEVGDVTYGGTVSGDNSGVIKYVRIEYSGNTINSEKEHNGLTLNGVGSGTTVEYVEVYQGKDDGFEFFGGTVNANYLVSIGSFDDCFDWTYGWTGKGEYWYAEQSADGGDRGIEGDNDSQDNANLPFSNPTLKYITLIGRSADGKDGIKLREGTRATINNVKIEGFDDAVDIQHNQTFDNVTSSFLRVSEVNAIGAKNEFKFSTMKKEDYKGADWAGDSTIEANKVASAQRDGILTTTTSMGSGTDWMTGAWIKK